MSGSDTADRPAPASIDEYIAGYPAERQQVLQEVRGIISAAAPDATETISYGIPTFNLKGHYLVYFAGYAKHVGMYPVTKGIEAQLGDEIAQYWKGKGTLQFPLGQPMPAELIRRIVEIRVAEATAPE